MKTTEIRWDVFSKDALPQALFGEYRADIYARPSFSLLDLASGQAALGFMGGQQNGGYNPPSVIVIDESAASEVLSWLHVYAPETSPLSQFARVITYIDWERFQPKNRVGNDSVTRSDAWACVVLGELLAHGESDTDITSIPLSRSSACFTTAVARTAIIHGDQEATRIVVQRLIELETDRRFAQRSVTIDDLLPAWSIVGARIEGAMTTSEIADVVLHSITVYLQESGKHVPFKSLTANFPGLTSDSMEQRVLTFQQVANEFAKVAQNEPHDLLTNVTIAAAAFLVGRGTTHAFLLRRWNKTFPLAFLWFGVMAALAGARQWDPNWSRAVKGIERVLRTTFNWADPPAADLCWAEFSWLATAFDGPEVFGGLPKMFTKVLSIEVAPGAACQFKLKSVAGKSTEADQPLQAAQSQREKDLQTALAQLIEAAAKAQHLLEPKSVLKPANQRSLPLEEKSEDKTLKRKRSKRPT